MKLSIIVPVYNVEKHLAACIDSIIAQSFCDWEMILVDDGSTDRSGEISDSYAQKDSRIRVLHCQNGGVSEARNRGIREMKGEFVTFIDSDDTIRPEFLANFSFDSSLDFEIQGFTLNFIGHEQDNKEVKPDETRIAPIKEIYAESELNKLSRGPYCKLFKRSIIIDNNVDYPKGIQFGEDAIFVKRYLTHCTGNGRSIATADYIYNHYPSQNSLTSKRHPGQMMYDVALLDYELFEQLEKKWDGISPETTVDFIHIRTLEFYQSIYLYLTEVGHTHSECCQFIDTVKQGLYQKIRNNQSLPITYKLIHFTFENLPTSLSVKFLRMIFKLLKMT